MKNRNNTEALDSLFTEADKLSDLGNFRGAFKLFKAAAEAGHTSSMNNLGYYYDVGKGVSKNAKQAMHWYKKALRRGDWGCAIANIGTIYRDKGNFERARFWFLKAIQKGDGDAALELGKFYLKRKKGIKQAQKYLRQASKSKNICPASREEAEDILRNIQRPLST